MDTCWQQGKFFEKPLTEKEEPKGTWLGSGNVSGRCIHHALRRPLPSERYVQASSRPRTGAGHSRLVDGVEIGPGYVSLPSGAHSGGA